MKTLFAFLIGGLLGYILGVTQPVDAEPISPDRIGHCRGNGDYGYRACRINFESPATKISLNVYVDGEYSFGMVYTEFGHGQYRQVK